jgi:hypothetical protein
MRKNRDWIVDAGPALLVGALLLASAAGLAAQGTAIPKKLDIGRAPALLAANCSPCHDWAKSYESIIAAVIAPGRPDESPAWRMISQDAMPPTGALGGDDKALILAWIEAGAPAPGQGAESGAAGSGTAAAGAGTGAAGAGGRQPSASFLGFANKEAFHRFSGWSSGGILLAAGLVGAAHAYGMWSTAHAWRDAHYPNLDEFSPATCQAEVAAVYNDPTQQALGWTHVGLLAAGGTFYIANAVTGSSFMGKLGPGWSKAKIHRYAFFVHAGLMVSEAVMGYFTTQALSRGDHDTFHSLLIAHAGVGLAIPVIILGAGSIMDPKVRL